MITVNGATWTDTTETLMLKEIFKNKHKGQEIAEPICEFCKKITEYIVEDYPFKKGVANVIAICHPPLFLHDEKVYIPVRNCWKCGAKYAGIVDAENKDNPNPQKMGLTDEEQHEWFEIYSMAKYKKREEITVQSSESNAGSKRTKKHHT